MRKICFIFVLLLLIASSCATTGKFRRLELGLTKSQVEARVGNPAVVRGSLVNKYGQTIEVWEYAEYKTSDDAFIGRASYYWIYFCDGKVVQWGQAGDWRREVDRIYEMRFR